MDDYSLKRNLRYMAMAPYSARAVLVPDVGCSVEFTHRQAEIGRWGSLPV